MSQPPNSLPEGRPVSSITPVSHDDVNHTPTSPKQGLSGCAWGVIGMLGCSLMIFIPLVLAVLLGLTSINGIFGGIQSIFSQRITASVMSSQTIVREILPKAELVTASAQLAKSGILIGVQQGAANACGYSADHVATGTIEAGVNLADLNEQSVVYDALTDTYTVTVPAPRLTSCHIDQIQQYNVTFTACSQDVIGAQALASYIAITEFRDDAIEGGLLKRAEREARLALRDLMTQFTTSKVVIEFAPPDNVYPISCQPEVPASWSFDATANAWVKK